MLAHEASVPLLCEGAPAVIRGKRTELVDICAAAVFVGFPQRVAHVYVATNVAAALERLRGFHAVFRRPLSLFVCEPEIPAAVRIAKVTRTLEKSERREIVFLITLAGTNAQEDATLRLAAITSIPIRRVLRSAIPVIALRAAHRRN